MASLSEVKKYFEFPTSKEFKDEWVRMSNADQTELRRLVASVGK
jgi:hypothetical protein